jgi:hypothetical protein
MYDDEFTPLLLTLVFLKGSSGVWGAPCTHIGHTGLGNQADFSCGFADSHVDLHGCRSEHIMTGDASAGHMAQMSL